MTGNILSWQDVSQSVAGFFDYLSEAVKQAVTSSGSGRHVIWLTERCGLLLRKLDIIIIIIIFISDKPNTNRNRDIGYNCAIIYIFTLLYFINLSASTQSQA